MNVNRLFVGYMVVVGLVVGAILVAGPHLGDLAIKPFFWMLIASFLFDVSVAWRARTVPGLRLAMEWRLLGFAAGVALMIFILNVTGSPAKYF